MTVRICDKCGKQIDYTGGCTLRVCFDMNTMLEKDVCENCAADIISVMDSLFEKKEEKHVGD